jgi:homoserine dehydrogenase
MQDKLKALESASGTTLELKAVCVRDVAKQRDWEVPAGCVLTSNYKDIVGNKDIDLVIEVAGGVTDAKDVVMGAIASGQDVVTANKALIAACMTEIKAELAKQPKVQFGYEAAVMGGIPIILALQNDFVGDQITGLQGIMNGCTNFMLTKMAATGCSYQEVLGEAQALGYAEADPTLDVGGQDARSKLKILLTLAFGAAVEEAAIPCSGITELLPVDFSYAKQMGGTIKLLGSAKLSSLDGKLRAFVAPAFVPGADTLASIGGATNAMNIESKNLGSTLLVSAVAAAAAAAPHFMSFLCIPKLDFS